jgi:hypothetical protein
VVVTPNRIYDAGISRTALLANARYTGMIRSRDREGTSVSFGGPSIFALLGDESGKGPTLLTCQWPASGGNDLADVWSTAAASPAYGLFNTSLPLGRVNGLTAGTVWDNFTLTTTFSVNTYNSNLDSMVTRWGVIEELAEEDPSTPYEFRVNADGSVDVGKSGTTTAGFVTVTPKALVWSGPSSTEPDGTAVIGGTISVHEDADDWISSVRVYYNYSGNIDPFTSTTTVDRTHSYKDFGGSAALFMAIVLADAQAPDSTAAKSGANIALAEQAARYTVTADCESRPDLHRYARPGDYVYAYDPDVGLDKGFSWNTGAFEAVVGGVTINPAKGRIQSIEWPITEGMGVYLCSNTWGTITDASEWVDFEDGTTRIDLGESIRKQNLQNLVKSSNWKRS